MRVFITGATGFVGTAVVEELIAGGHDVVGLARSDEGAAKVERAGATVHRGALEDLDSLRAGARDADGVIHLAFIHDFSNFVASAEADRAAIAAIGETLVDSGRPLVVTSGLAFLAQGRRATENDVPSDAFPRRSEAAAFAFLSRDVRAIAMRLAPTVHDAGDHGFVPALIQRALDNGASMYAGSGENRWAAVHRRDAARLFRLAIESAPAGARLHAVGEEGIPMREIATKIGEKLAVSVKSVTPEEAQERLGWLAMFATMDVAASSAITQERMNWRPTHQGLMADLDSAYFEPVTQEVV
ncbi:MAG TPA: SDR family oxidoreductase [Candidatus Aquilonibacter sp.]|nr:SDR family oxidoreductase [Candidatus Aquilonibacter sp.]